VHVQSQRNARVGTLTSIARIGRVLCVLVSWPRRAANGTLEGVL